MPWKTMDLNEQRVQFVVAAVRREKTLGELCQEFGISRPTGRLWLGRYRELGVAGLQERSRRPQRSPRLTATRCEQQVIELRRQYPDWGARKLQWLLARQGVSLSVSTVHRILLRHDLLTVEDRYRTATRRFQRNAPNELWQMDFKSPIGWGTHVGPLSVLDDYSRYVIVLHATGSTRAELVREQLEQAFTQCGLPHAMLMDHGTPWWNTATPSGVTALTLWLMRQGVQLRWSGFRHPQTQGKVERFHGSLHRAIARRGLPPADRQLWLDAYRHEYNYQRPHEALGMQPPATHWQPSLRRYDPHPPAWEYPTAATVVRVDIRGQLWTAGRRWFISEVLAGQSVQILPVENRLWVLYCNTVVRELDLVTQQSRSMESW